MTPPALVIFAHGSRIEPANEAVRVVARQLADTAGYAVVEPAFLELGQPDLAGAVGRCAAAGAREVVVIPYFLTLGMHLQRDLPRIVADLTDIHPGVAIRVTPPLDGHPGLLAVLLDRAQAALREKETVESQAD